MSSGYNFQAKYLKKKASRPDIKKFKPPQKNEVREDLD